MEAVTAPVTASCAPPVPHRRIPRLLLLARFSLVPTLVFLIAKVALWFASPNWFLLAYILFSSGIVLTKAWILLRNRQHARLSFRARRVADRALYRRTGVILLALAIGVVLTSVPVLLGDTVPPSSDFWIGIAIAAVAFTEITLSLIGFVTGRRDGHLIASALRRVNLASELMLLALAQAALLSALAPGYDAVNGLAVVLLGTVCALLGAGMLYRTPKA